MPRDVPEPHVLRQWASAAAINASTLIYDARTLLAAERWPRAYSLAVLALEEIGKASRCLATADAIEHGEEPDPREFFDGVRLHDRKLVEGNAFLTYIVDVGRLGSDVVARIHQESQSQASTKMLGLYVDYADGDVLAPDTSISEERARSMVQDVESALPAVYYFAGLSDDVL